LVNHSVLLPRSPGRQREPLRTIHASRPTPALRNAAGHEWSCCPTPGSTGAHAPWGTAVPARKARAGRRGAAPQGDGSEAPAAHVEAVRVDFDMGWWGGKRVGHPVRVKVIQKKKGPGWEHGGLSSCRVGSNDVPHKDTLVPRAGFDMHQR
jgi:hypothetical protein